MQRKLTVLILLIIFIVSSVGCSQNSQDDYIAKVNDQKISKADFELRVKQGAAMNNFDLEDPQYAPYIDIFKLQILDRMIDELLLENEARNVRKLEVNEEDVDKELTAIKEQFNSQEEFTQYFKEQLQMDEKDIKKAIETQLLVQALYEEVTKDITETNTDIEKYYEENKAEFFQDEQVKARHILVKTEEEAKEIIRLITEENQDMGELAVLKSIEPAAKTTKGDLGYFGRGAMVKPFEDAAFALEVGEITTEPVQTTFGYHVIKLEDKIPAKQLSFEEVKDELKDRFLYEEKSQVFATFMEDLKEKATIENKLQEEIDAKNQASQEENQEETDGEKEANDDDKENEQ